MINFAIYSHSSLTSLPVADFGPALQRINNSPFEFWLTGSFYFGNYTIDSDLDLYVADENAVHQFIISLGGVVLNGVAGYSDSNTKLVYRIKNPTIMLRHIDIQISKDVKRKKYLERKIMCGGSLYTTFISLDKGDRRSFYNSLYSLTSYNEEEEKKKQLPWYHNGQYHPADGRPIAEGLSMKSIASRSIASRKGQTIKKQDTCTNCGSLGEDLIFKFYCSNPSCSNYKP